MSGTSGGMSGSRVGLEVCTCIESAMILIAFENRLRTGLVLAPSLDRVSGTLCLSHYVTEISHLNSLRAF